MAVAGADGACCGRTATLKAERAAAKGPPPGVAVPLGAELPAAVVGRSFVSDELGMSK